MHSLASTKLLLQRQVPSALPTPLANACRFAARQILDLLQVSVEEEAAPGLTWRRTQSPALSASIR